MYFCINLVAPGNSLSVEVIQRIAPDPDHELAIQCGALLFQQPFDHHLLQLQGTVKRIEFVITYSPEIIITKSLLLSCSVLS